MLQHFMYIRVVSIFATTTLQHMSFYKKVFQSIALTVQKVEKFSTGLFRPREAYKCMYI